MSLQSFLKMMERRGEIILVREDVSPRSGVSPFMKAFDGGPILFFEKVKDCKTDIVANLCGTRERIWADLKVWKR